MGTAVGPQRVRVRTNLRCALSGRGLRPAESDSMKAHGSDPAKEDVRPQSTWHGSLAWPDAKPIVIYAICGVAEHLGVG